jgi:hypothetical protein
MPRPQHDAQELLSVSLQLDRANPSDVSQRGHRSWPAGGHLDERAIREDNVRRHAIALRDFRAQRSQSFE